MPGTAAAGTRILSVEQQAERIAEFCKANGYALTREFKDIAKSGGKIAGREQFLDMVSYLKDAEEQALIIWSYSRFSRDYDDSQFYLALLRSYGKRIISITDNVPDTLDGRVMEALVAWQHAKFRETLAKDVRRGMRYAIGYHRGVVGAAPAGYTTEEVTIGTRRDGSAHVIKRLVLGDDAHLVRKAYEMRLEGRTYKEINRATRLFPFLQSYREMLKNPIYKGVLEWGGEMYEDYAPPIVDADLWEQVQVVSARMTRHPRRVSSSYLLSGLMKCRRCGSNMNGNTSVRKDKTHRYYRCSNDKTFDDTEPCSMRFIVAQDLEDKVMGRLAEFYLSADELAALYTEMREQAGVLVGEYAREQEQARKEQAENRKRIDRIITAIKDTGHSPAMLEELKQLEDRQAEIETRLVELRHETRQAEMPEIPDLEAFGAEVWQAVMDADQRKRQLLLRELVDVIRVDKIGKRIEGEIVIKGAGKVLEF